ncbi:hypothetical protein ASC90_26195 [Rhizobium sp. Root1220]|nr:hypothetical protein ASC90_26195 [Rhizobium sp. Root1220]
MPGLPATVGDQIEALRRVAGDDATKFIRRAANAGGFGQPILQKDSIPPRRIRKSISIERVVLDEITTARRLRR